MDLSSELGQPPVRARHQPSTVNAYPYAPPKDGKRMAGIGRVDAPGPQATPPSPGPPFPQREVQLLRMWQGGRAQRDNVLFLSIRTWDMYLALCWPPLRWKMKRYTLRKNPEAWCIAFVSG